MAAVVMVLMVINYVDGDYDGRLGVTFWLFLLVAGIVVVLVMTEVMAA